jgi:HK97 family phage major capsid protein
MVLSAGLLRSAVNAAEDYAFLRGTGVNQPLGVINAGATYFLHRAGSNAISYADLVGMVARLLMRGNVNSPIWSMPQQALPQIATMVDPEGHYIWQSNSNGAKDGLAGALLGYPVRWNNRAPRSGLQGRCGLGRLVVLHGQGRLRPIRRGLGACEVPGEQDRHQDLLEC